MVAHIPCLIQTIKKSGWAKLIIWVKSPPLSEMMRSGKDFQHVSKT